MCGIAGYFDIDGAHPPTIQMAVAWSLLAARGTDAAGIMWCSNNKVHLWKAAQRSYDVAVPVWARDIASTHPRWAAVHSRSASKGDAENIDNNHPVQHGNILVMHNGNVSNDAEVFTKLGVKRAAQVDTEAIAACLHIGGLPKLLELARGTMAIAWADVEKPTELHLYTNGGALWVTHTKGEMASYASTDFYLPTSLLGEQRGEVPTGMHLILSPAGVVEDKVGVGQTHYYPPQPPQSTWPLLGNEYICYNAVECKQARPHTHKYTNYPLSLHSEHLAEAKHNG